MCCKILPGPFTALVVRPAAARCHKVPVPGPGWSRGHTAAAELGLVLSLVSVARS